MAKKTKVIYNQIKVKKKPKKKKKKLRALRLIKKDLLDEVKLFCKNRDSWLCQKCGTKVSGSNAHGSHVIPVSRGNMFTFDPLNIKTMCFHCHMNWWHKEPTASGDWFKKKFPDRWAYLDVPIISVKFSRDWYAEQTTKYRKLNKEN